MRILTILIGFMILGLPCSFVQAQTSPEQLVRHLTLPDEFTLVYNVTKKDVRSQELRKGSLSLIRSQQEIAVKAGAANKNQSEAWLEKVADSLQAIHPPEKFSITVSVKNGKILYQLAKDNLHFIFALYDGDHTFYFQKNLSRTYEKRPGERGELLPGNGALCDTLLPLPGVSLPFLPLIKAPVAKTATAFAQTLTGQSPVINRGPNSEIPYTSSHVDVAVTNVGVEAKNCVLWYPDGRVLQRWDYQKHEKFANVGLASRMTFTDYTAYESHGKMLTAPEFTYTYELVSAKQKALPDQAFTPAALLSDGTGVQDSRTKDIIGFGFRKDGGSMEKQIKRARWEQAQDKAKIESGNIKGSKLSGAFLLLALCSGAGAWWWRKRQAAI